MKLLQNTFYATLLFLVVVILSGCRNGANSVAENSRASIPFIISDAYVQNWVAGLEAGGSGTDFFLRLKEPAPNVQFKKVYFHGGEANLERLPDSTLTFIARFANTLTSDIIMDSDSAQEVQNEIGDRVRLASKDTQAVVSYFYQKKLFYHTLDSVPRKESLNYPTPPPN
ncbi:MAG: hypothetical protein CMC08_03715 [Flavobacteriaceae bacterium]|nr:hypothetical protein [Flavobacteriaceae bacterium]